MGSESSSARTEKRKRSPFRSYAAEKRRRYTNPADVLLCEVLNEPHAAYQKILYGLANCLKVKQPDVPQDEIANIIQYALIKFDGLIENCKKARQLLSTEEKNALAKLIELLEHFSNKFTNDRYLSVVIHRMGKMSLALEDKCHISIKDNVLNALFKQFIQLNPQSERILSVYYGLGAITKANKRFPDIDTKTFIISLSHFFDLKCINLIENAKIMYALGCMATAENFPSLSEKLKKQIAQAFINSAREVYKLTAKDSSHLFYGLGNLAMRGQLAPLDGYMHTALNDVLIDLPKQRELTNQSVAIIVQSLGQLAMASRYPKLTDKAQTSLEEILIWLADRDNLAGADISNTLDGIGKMLEGGMHLSFTPQGLRALKKLLFKLPHAKALSAQHISNALHGFSLVIKAEIGLTIEKEDWPSIVKILKKLNASRNIIPQGIASSVFSVSRFVEMTKTRALPSEVEQALTPLLLKFSNMHELSTKASLPSKAACTSQMIANVLYGCAYPQLKDNVIKEIFFKIFSKVNLKDYAELPIELSQLHLAARYALFLLKDAKNDEEKKLKAHYEVLYTKIASLLGPTRTSKEQMQFFFLLNETLKKNDIKVTLHSEYPSCGFIIDIALEFYDNKDRKKRLAIEINGPHHARYAKHFAFRAYLLRKWSGWKTIDYPLPRKTSDLEEEMRIFIEENIVPEIKRLQIEGSLEKAQEVGLTLFSEKKVVSGKEEGHYCVDKKGTPFAKVLLRH